MFYDLGFFQVKVISCRAPPGKFNENNWMSPAKVASTLKVTYVKVMEDTYLFVSTFILVDFH